jgi:hypothetical protein
MTLRADDRTREFRAISQVEVGDRVLMETCQGST